MGRGDGVEGAQWVGQRVIGRTEEAGIEAVARSCRVVVAIADAERVELGRKVIEGEGGASPGAETLEAGTARSLMAGR